MPETVSIEVTDPTRQRVSRVSDLPPDSSVGEMVSRMLPLLRLPDSDSDGRPFVYQARLDREGRSLNSGERIGDVLKNADRVTLLPRINAG